MPNLYPWGGYSNGDINFAELASPGIPFVSIPGTHSSATLGSDLLRADAARQLGYAGSAFQTKFSKPMVLSEGYRNLAVQNMYWDDKLAGRLQSAVAQPGSSLHGWALAADLASGIATPGSPEKVWADANLPHYGWFPIGNTFGEAWHFEYQGGATITTASETIIAIAKEHNMSTMLVKITAKNTGRNDGSKGGKKRAPGNLVPGMYFTLDFGARTSYMEHNGNVVLFSQKLNPNGAAVAMTGDQMFAVIDGGFTSKNW